MERKKSVNETDVIWKCPKTEEEVKLNFQEELNLKVKEMVLEILLDAYTNRIQDHNVN